MRIHMGRGDPSPDVELVTEMAESPPLFDPMDHTDLLPKGRGFPFCSQDGAFPA